uniref:Uncharacterized protein n=1 Tax=Kalanchoe fedtschenkoi TaxID=63787 RepID=A0A7N0TKK4_KALFE
MASSLASHLCAFIFFFPVGVRRLHSFFSFYLNNSPSSSFRSKVWYSSSSTSTIIRNLDLYILLIALPIASFSDLYLFFSILPHRIPFLHHYALLTFFWLLLLLLLLHDSLLLLPLPDTFLFLFAATAFLLDFYLVVDNDHDGDLVSSVAYHLSASLSLLCGASCVFLSVCPCSFLADFALSTGLVFKGVWILQVGFNLYSDAFTFMGCKKNIEGRVKCDLQEDTLRAITLINLLFVSHAIGIVFGSFALFGFLSCTRAVTRIPNVATGPLLEALNNPI